MTLACRLTPVGEATRRDERLHRTASDRQAHTMSELGSLRRGPFTKIGETLGRWIAVLPQPVTSAWCWSVVPP